MFEGSGELLQGLNQLLELRRGRRLLHGGDVLDDCLNMVAVASVAAWTCWAKSRTAVVEFCPMTFTLRADVAMV